jgi:hypothetical protein
MQPPAKLERFGYHDYMIKHFCVKELLEIRFQWAPWLSYWQSDLLRPNKIVENRVQKTSHINRE